MDVGLAMLLSFAIGLFIFFVYKKTFAGVMYSASFGVSIMAMTLITTLIILAVTSNIILSLGMVGALSIVRFRTAVKETLDIAFLFWAISAGIVIGAGLFPLGIIASGRGLSIVKKIIEIHDGEYGVESEIGKGSVFWFTLNKD
ncbi:MAG: DUF4956 domain-containing protein [Anaerococcus sp.]